MLTVKRGKVEQISVFFYYIKYFTTYCLVKSFIIKRTKFGSNSSFIQSVDHLQVYHMILTKIEKKTEQNMERQKHLSYSSSSYLHVRYSFWNREQCIEKLPSTLLSQIHQFSPIHLTSLQRKLKQHYRKYNTGMTQKKDRYGGVILVKEQACSTDTCHRMTSRQ